MDTLQRFRTSLRFSLWVWALYWPGGGLLLMANGLDPISIAVTVGSLACFLILLRGGALRPDRTSSTKEFLLERPIYLVATLVLLIVISGTLGALENFGLGLFATVYLGGIVLSAWRLVAHLRATKEGVISSGADQLFLVFAMAGAAAFLVWFDAIGPAFGDVTVGASAMTVALVSWLNLLYAPLVMVASRPFREPLSWGKRAEPEPTDAPVADGAAPAE